jgi:hypothetical protein
MSRSFDPTRAVEFDLPRGAVEGSGERLLVVPATLLAELAHQVGGAAAVVAARAIGAACGTRAAARLGGAEGVRAASVEDALSHLAGELAVCGVGALRLERWGRALVVVVEHCAIADDACLEALVEGAIGAAVERDVRAATLAREAGEARVLVASEGAIERAKTGLASGGSWGDVLVRIQARGEA